MAGPTGEQDWYVSGVFNMSFLNLNDTIGDYINRANKILKVNATEDGVTVVDAQFEDHSARHENGGADEISVAGLSGDLADAQDAKSHSLSHEDGGGDEISVAGLSGVLADKQDPQAHAARHKDAGADELDVVELAGALGTANQVPKSDGAAVSWGNVDHSEVTGVGSDDHHSQLHGASHEDGGGDEISVAGLSGVLADEQNPVDHASEHEAGASDELGPIGNKTNGVIRLINPGGAANIWDTTSETGAIQIALPTAVNDMIYFYATVFEYYQQKAFDVIIFAHQTTAGPYWSECTAIILGDNPNTKRVRFCRNSDSSQWYVIIGDTDTSWNYPWIAITDFKAGHTPIITDWNSGWSMSLITSMPSYTDFDFTDARVSPEDHASRHEDGGGDPVNIVNLPDYSETTVELGGDFDAGENIKIVKIGNWVWIFGEGVLSHTENNYANSASGVIPSEYRPLYQNANPYSTGVAGHAVAKVLTGGTFTTEYYGFDGSLPNKPNTVDPPEISYPVA